MKPKDRRQKTDCCLDFLIFWLLLLGMTVVHFFFKCEKNLLSYQGCCHVAAGQCCRSRSLETRTVRPWRRRFLQPHFHPSRFPSTPLHTCPYLETQTQFSHLQTAEYNRQTRQRNQPHQHIEQVRFVLPWSFGPGRADQSHSLTYKTHHRYPVENGKKKVRNQKILGFI